MNVTQYKKYIMKLEIYNDNKRIKGKKSSEKEVRELKEILSNQIIDFTSLKNLVGDKKILDKVFKQTKIEYQNG